MNNFFIVVQEKVKYPTWCESGLVLKSENGILEYPVDNFLGRKLINQVGCIVEENIDFEVIEVGMDKAYLCDKGEISGGELKEDGEWYTSLLEEDENGNQKEYKRKDLKPIQFARCVESPQYLENIKWRKILDDLRKEMPELKSHTEITYWFRSKIKKQD